MKKLIIASTSTIHGSSYLEYLLPSLTSFFNGVSTLLFIPYARPGGISFNEYTKQAAQVFNKIGIDVKGIHEYRNSSIAVTNAECEKRGQTPKAGTKQLKVEEFLAVYQEFYNMPAKTLGTVEDFMEGLKLYDKEQNGKLQLSELNTVLVNMGTFKNE